MCRFLYSILLCLLMPLVIIRLLVRSIKAPAYRQRISERFAFIPKRETNTPLLWVHAVSVGETLAAIPLIKKLKKENNNLEVCLTTTTPTGSDQVKKAFGDTVLHCYLPYDFACLIKRFVKKIQPNALVIMETELWPNTLAVCSKTFPVILANGRMSEKSYRGYKALSALTRPMFNQLTLVAAQSNDDGGRFLDLGVPAEKLTITGSIKYDISLTQSLLAKTEALRSVLSLSGRRVIIIASTHDGEDEQIIPVLKRLHMRDTRVLGLVVPRHPERFTKVEKICEQHLLPFQNVSHSEAVHKESVVLIGDTMGDLLAFYGLSDVAFVGGSLIDHGGHNYLEAALWSLPIITGFSMFNFQHVADKLIAAHGLISVNDSMALERTLVDMLDNPERAISMGQAAESILKMNQGALGRLSNRISAFL
ncbi:MAG: lipid IV(A) 3-deoxy-D-manno-octulosonic acid transferase [Cellvibrionales bacterium]|nr:lipid IV(A) 3-deoxy-D-manno-octulosonic acid transferase [Cellvibrionales bacterium]